MNQFQRAPPPHSVHPPQVTSGFKSKSMAAALPPPFLDPLFSISLMEDSELRQLVLEILHNIIDRHDNRAKLRGIRCLLISDSHTGLCVWSPSNSWCPSVAGSFLMLLL